MVAHLLRSLPLFASLPDDEIEHMAATLASRQFTPGELVMQEGVADGRCIVIVDGRVEVIKALGTTDERLLNVREAGSLLGEMSLFTYQGAHTASVRAATQVSLLEFTRNDLNALLQRQPHLAYEIIGLVSRRLEESENETIQNLREKNVQLEKAYHDLKAAQAQLIAQEKLQRELDIARNIQLSFLPPEMPSAPGYEFGAMIIPARAVGGDLYDFIPLGDDRLGIVIGDVSDKGVPAALVMALTYSLLHAEAYRQGNPGEVLAAVNRLLLEMNNMGMFVTLVYGVLDFARGEFAYARAGHPFPVLLDGEGRVLTLPERNGMAVGILDEPEFDEGCVVLPCEGVLCLYSDGLSEAPAPGGEGELGQDGIAALLADFQAYPAMEICHRLWSYVQASGSESQQDDFTVVIVKRREK